MKAHATKPTPVADYRLTLQIGADSYDVRPVSKGGRAWWRLRKPDGTPYDVVPAGGELDAVVCTCPARVRCKHIRALGALGMV